MEQPEIVCDHRRSIYETRIIITQISVPPSNVLAENVPTPPYLFSYTLFVDAPKSVMCTAMARSVTASKAKENEYGIVVIFFAGVGTRQCP
jgi:hypothetical protein